MALKRWLLSCFDCGRKEERIHDQRVKKAGKNCPRLGPEDSSTSILTCNASQYQSKSSIRSTERQQFLHYLDNVLYQAQQEFSPIEEITA